MKNWNGDSWVKFLLAVTVFFFMATYIVGMFVLKQETNEANKDLRFRLVDILALIVMKLLVDNTGDKNNKDDKNKNQ